MAGSDLFSDVTTDEVRKALENAPFDGLPNDPAALLEFFHRMLDVILGEGVGTDE